MSKKIFSLIIVIVFLITIFTGCAMHKPVDYKPVQPKPVGDNNQPIQNEEPEQDENNLINIASELFEISNKEEILNKLGTGYEIVPSGIEGSEDGYKYEKLGILLTFYEDNTLAVIYIVGEDTTVVGYELGMNFEQIKSVFGEGEVLEDWYETPENKVYELNYELSNLKLNFISSEKNGEGSTLRILGIYEKSSLENSNTENSNIRQISREEAGLDTLKSVNINHLKVNPRIEQLLNVSNDYNDKDYQNGLFYGGYRNVVIVKEHFNDNILGNIKLGMNIEEVKKTFGKPSYIKDDYIYYKSSPYYIGIKGNRTVELVALTKPKENNYDKDILYEVLSNINPQVSLQDIVNQDSSLSDFLVLDRHVNGGGFMTESINGEVFVEEFDDYIIEVHNNFVGNLYEYKNGRIKVDFINKDSVIENIEEEISSLDFVDKSFNEPEAKKSPSGKLAYIYEWNSSTSQYFTVRTLDNSKADKIFPVAAFESSWLNDRYIVYTDFYTGKPFFIDLENINGFLSENDIFNKVGLNIESLNDNEFIITENRLIFKAEGDTTLEVEYSFDNNGNIQFKYVE